MKKIAIALTLVLSSQFLFTGCHIGVKGSGVRKTEKRELPAFTAIETTGAFEVNVPAKSPPALKSKLTITFCR